MSGISAIYLLNSQGKLLISRSYRTDYPSDLLQLFCDSLLTYDETLFTPLKMINNNTLAHITISDVIILAISTSNVNIVMIFALLYKIKSVFESYFTIVNSESLKDNFVLIHELLDEMLDNGYPQLLDHDILKEFINTEAYKMKEKEEKEITKRISDKRNFRISGLKYDENEIFIEVTEEITMTISHQGAVLDSEVYGYIECESQLTGMPELSMKFNRDFVELFNNNSLVDFHSHDCIEFIPNKKSVRIIPPDGSFQLFNYKIRESMPSLFKINLNYLPRTSSIEFQLMIKANFKSQCLAQNIKVFIPVPCDVQKPNFLSHYGKAIYIPEKDCVEWSVEELIGGEECNLSAKFGLPSVESTERENYKRKPMELEFEIPDYTVSGVIIKELNLLNEEYDINVWVRYLTKNGRFVLKTSEIYLFLFF